MRVGILTGASSQYGRGHLSRQLTFCRHLVGTGHEVLLVTNRPDPATARPPNITILERDTLSHVSAADAISELHDLACERIVVDLPDAISALLPDTTAHLVDLAFVAPGTRHALPTRAYVEVGGDLDSVVTHATESHRGRQLHVHAGRGFVTFGDEYANVPVPIDARAEDHVLVTHGGADPWNLTQRTMLALEGCNGRYAVSVAIGPEFGGDIGVLEEMARTSRHDVRLVRGAPSLAPFMRSASFAVINGGMTRFELCRTGTPFLAIAANDHQHQTNQDLARLGAGIAAGLARDLSDGDVAGIVDTLMNDRARRGTMSNVMAALFDDRGVVRLEEALCDPESPVQP